MQVLRVCFFSSADPGAVGAEKSGGSPLAETILQQTRTSFLRRLGKLCVLAVRVGV